MKNALDYLALTFIGAVFVGILTMMAYLFVRDEGWPMFFAMIGTLAAFVAFVWASHRVSARWGGQYY